MPLNNAKFISFSKSMTILKFLLLVALLLVIWPIFPIISQNEENDKWSKCSGENMEYKLKINAQIIYGKKFDCAFKVLLDNFRLSDKFAITEKISVKHPGHPKFAFVTAANFAFWQSLRAVIAGIKTHFGCSQRIIVYDLGELSQNEDIMNELRYVPNLELRVFNFSQMRENVRALKAFSWKIFILSKMFTEFDTFLWVDTSIAFKNGNLTKFLVPMENGKIGNLVEPAFTGHGINFATHSETLEFLPLYTNFVEKNPPQKFNGTDNEFDPPMFQANFIIVHKSETTRQTFKWALLCAAEQKCIVPLGSTLNCADGVNRHKANECHRQDQSVISILRANMEFEQKQRDPSLLDHFDYKHPLNTLDEGNGLLEVNRGQTIDKSILCQT